jgi:hypothetical protein
MGFLDEAEGEGFEPSTDLTARNGFRDRHEHGRLQGVCLSFASLFASSAVVHRRVVFCSANADPTRDDLRLTMNVRRGSIHAGFGLVVPVFAPRKASDVAAFCMGVRPVRPSLRRVTYSIASAFRVLL